MKCCIFVGYFRDVLYRRATRLSRRVVSYLAMVKSNVMSIYIVYYSGGPGIKSQPANWLSWCSVFSAVLPGGCQFKHFKLGHGRFLSGAREGPHSDQATACTTEESAVGFLEGQRFVTSTVSVTALGPTLWARSG